MNCDNQLDIDSPLRTFRPVLPTVGRGGVVPYIASWTGEKMQTDRDLVYRPWRDGIAYADETPADRDEYGVLWLSTSGDLGTGRPLYKEQHGLRQRRAMADLLCQVCAQPADQTEQGTLWLLPAESTTTGSRVPRQKVTAFPPICLSCARISVAVCPALRSGALLVSAHSRLCGVTGVLYAPGQDKPGLSAWDGLNQVVPHDSTVASWMLAVQLHRVLYRMRRVDWDEVA